jgi:hypothetical protein
VLSSTGSRTTAAARAIAIATATATATAVASAIAIAAGIYTGGTACAATAQNSAVRTVAKVNGSRTSA